MGTYDITPGAPGIRLNVGLSGAGKTHTIRQNVYDSVRAGMPVIVVDRMREWSEVPADIAPLTHGAADLESAQNAVAHGRRLIIVRCPAEHLEAVAKGACMWARDYDGVAGVAFPEAHRIAPSKRPLQHDLEDIVTAWRHYRVALWVDTQRIALLNTTVVEQASELRIFAIAGRRDQEVVRELGGRELKNAVRRCAERLRDDEPGWHVRLTIHRLPPYPIVRLNHDGRYSVMSEDGTAVDEPAADGSYTSQEEEDDERPTGTPGRGSEADREPPPDGAGPRQPAPGPERGGSPDARGPEPQ